MVLSNQRDRGSPAILRPFRLRAYAAVLRDWSLALYLLGYSGSGTGAFGVLDNVQPLSRYVGYVNDCGGAILIVLTETWHPMRYRLSGRAMRWVGEMSFPIYLATSQ